MYIVPLSSIPSLSGISAVTETGSDTPQVGQGSFSAIIQEALDTLRSSQEAAAQDSYSLAMGDVSDLHSLMINSAMETTAVETVVQLTSRAVSAYKEIMQMQI